MLAKKPIYNYDLEQVNLLLKKGVNPIGVGTNNKTGKVFHVFIASKKYFEMLKLIEYEQKEKEQKISKRKYINQTQKEHTLLWKKQLLSLPLVKQENY